MRCRFHASTLVRRPLSRDESSACHRIRLDDWSNSFVESLQLLPNWIIRLCELENALSPEHCTLGLLTSVKRQRSLLVAFLSSFRPVGGDVYTEL